MFEEQQQSKPRPTLLSVLTSITFMVGLLRIAPAARAVAVAPTRLLVVVALTNADADGLTNAFTSANPNPQKTSATAATTLIPSTVLVHAALKISEEVAAF